MIPGSASELVAGTYAIDAAASRIRFTATHAFGLVPVTGSLTARDATITIAEDPANCAVTARIDAASFTTGNALRDKAIRSKWYLNTQKHPDVLFVAGHVRRDGDRWLLYGKLTVRGTTAQATIELSSATTTDAGVCRFRAHARIDRYSHRVGPPGILGRHVDVEFDIVASTEG